MMASAPSAAPMPIPALAPVLRPLDGVGVGVGLVVGLEVGLLVPVALVLEAVDDTLDEEAPILAASTTPSPSLQRVAFFPPQTQDPSSHCPTAILPFGFPPFWHSQHHESMMDRETYLGGCA